MAVTFSQIFRQCAVRVNSMAGSTQAALETAYTTSPLTTTQVDGADFPLSLYRDACLNVEEKLATAIATFSARDKNGKLRFHPWRSYLASLTAALSHGSLTPSIDGLTVSPIVGVFGSVVDGSDSTVCEEWEPHEIRKVVANAGSWLKTSVYAYAFEGDRILHTRTTVKLDCCVYNRTTRTTAIATLTNNILLPDALEEAYVSGMLSLLIRDDAFTSQAAIFRGYFNDTLQMIGQGLGSVPMRAAA